MNDDYNARRVQELEEAFVMFNQLSEQLSSSYAELQDEVQGLTDELVEAKSERLRQLQEKERLADHLERLINVMPNGMVVLDGNDVIRSCNQAALTLLGEPLLNLFWDDVIERCFISDTKIEGAELKTRQGRYLTMASSHLGKEPGQILLFNDVSETFMLRENLNRHQRLSSMGEMAASLAHQIRTPLAAALLHISHLVKPDLGQESRIKFAEKVRSRLRHLEGLVSDMLHYARGGGASNEKIRLGELADAMVQAVELQVQAGLCSFTVEYDLQNVDTMEGNNEAILTALHNLVNNAIEVKDTKANVLFILQEFDEKQIELVIEDDGPGIDKDFQAKIFEPFYTSRARGTGLGLAVVQAVVDAHQGEVWVDSELGEGCAFGLRLPIKVNPDTLEL
jgi:two-component system, sensor histidine kinase FlrB